MMLSITALSVNSGSDVKLKAISSNSVLMEDFKSISSSSVMLLPPRRIFHFLCRILTLKGGGNMSLTDKEIAKELFIASVSKLSISAGANYNERAVDEITKLYKALYTTVRDVDTD
jgi:hypothetical protein